jgi:hypothetical protein
MNDRKTVIRASGLMFWASLESHPALPDANSASAMSLGPVIFICAGKEPR